MLVDSTRLKCKREWKQIITYPLQKFFHGCIVISHLLTFEIKNMFCNNLFKFQCHPSHRIIIQQQGGVHHGNKWLHQELLWRPLSKDQRRRRRRYALFGILSTSVTMDPAMPKISCLTVICLENHVMSTQLCPDPLIHSRKTNISA